MNMKISLKVRVKKKMEEIALEMFPQIRKKLRKYARNIIEESCKTDTSYKLFTCEKHDHST